VMPYWRLSGFYLFYFAALGALMPFWSLYLKAEGFDAVAIGELMAILMATKVVAPNLWGWLADHTGRRMAVVRLGSLLATVTFAGVFLGSSYAWLAVVMALFSFFWNAVLPQFEAVTMNWLGREVHRYTTVRLWGSIGFILTVIGLGAALGAFGTALLPWVLLLIFAGIWMASFTVPEQPEPAQHADHSSLRSVLLRPEVAVFLAVCFLMQASHGAYYSFYTLYMEGYGYSRGLIGQLWALGVIAEIVLFLWVPRFLPRFGAQRVLAASLALAALRWLVIGTQPEHLSIMLLAQLLHAASFGTYHAAAIHLVHHYFVGRNQGRGQALYSSVSFGAGGAVGSLASGYLWTGLGPPSTFIAAGGMAAVAWALAWAGLRAGAGREV